MDRIKKFKGYIAEDKNLILREFSLPALKAYEVLIKVKAIGVNHADLLQLKGHYPVPDGASSILGLEASGVIEAVGAAVKSFSVGINVMALLDGGGYAEYVVVDAALCMEMPVSLSFEEAACVPETFASVWLNLFMLNKFNLNQVFLVHGGGGGIGTTAISLVKHFGSKVIVTCGSDEKCHKADKLGADLTINYKAQDFALEVKKYCLSVDVILDSVGGAYLDQHLEILQEKGKLILIGTMKGVKGDLNLLKVIRKRISIIGSILRTISMHEKVSIIEQLKGNVIPLLKKGLCKPVIHKSFPFNSAIDALNELRGSEHFGKIVIKTED